MALAVQFYQYVFVFVKSFAWFVESFERASEGQRNGLREWQRKVYEIQNEIQTESSHCNQNQRDVRNTRSKCQADLLEAFG